MSYYDSSLPIKTNTMSLKVIAALPEMSEKNKIECTGLSI